jgi:NADH:ubiquinone oxidoreductase subunit E
MHNATQDAPPFTYSEAARNEVLGIIKKYPEGKGKSAILRALHIAQEENNG